MDKRLIMIAVILVFAYIGVTTDSHGADIYNSIVPGLFDNPIDESKLFLGLVVILGSCYFFKSKEIALFYNKKDDSNPGENDESKEPSEQEDEVITEDITKDKVASEDVIKEKYEIDEN